MKFTTFKPTENITEIEIDNALLQCLPCGLHRAPMDEAKSLLPELFDLYESAPIPKAEWKNWEIDIKIHMLMPGQFPCIPNWHCDNVPRVDGKTKFSLVDEAAPPMYLWISGSPETEFLAGDMEIPEPRSHGNLSEIIARRPLDTVKMPSQQWVSMDQLTPHRGVQADSHCWRIFARITHKSILPARPVISKVRRHAQVYLPRDFYWWPHANNNQPTTHLNPAVLRGRVPAHERQPMG